MRITLMTLGSTGDVQPMAVLGKALVSRGHDVTLVAFSALKPLLAGSGIHFHPLPGDAEKYIGSIIRPGAYPLTYLKRLESSLSGVAEPLLDALLASLAGADAVVSTFLGAIPYTLCEHLKIPLIQSNYCLTDATGTHCLPVMAQPRLGVLTAPFNRATYHTAYRMIGWVEERYVVPWAKARGIRPRTLTASGPRYEICGRPVPVLYAASPHVLPLPGDYPQGITSTGFWEETAQPFGGDPALEAFLNAADPPVYIGFGSMTAGDMRRVLAIALDALTKTGLRAVLSKGWSSLGDLSLPETVFLQRSFIPHHWLFKRVSAVIHHGGAGTTAAGLAGGRPTLVVPFGADQFFWGERVHALGCGPRPLPRTQLTARRLADRLALLSGNASYAENAARIGRLLREGNGAMTAAAMVEEAVRRWNDSSVPR